MARIETDPNYNAPTFSRATAPTDIFKKEDVQNVAAAFSTHTHDGSGKGLAVAFTGVPPGSIPGTALADGAVTSVKIADGTIATVDLANAAVTNAKLASDTDRSNLLTNGGFEIWQRGAGPFTSGYSSDRWGVVYQSVSTFSVTRIVSTVGAPGYSLQLAYTHGASGIIDYGQTIEDTGGQLAGRPITFAATVKASVNGSVRLVLQGRVSGIAANSAYNSGTSSQRLSVTYTPGATDTTGVYAMLEMSVATTTIEINDAMVVVGSQAADYAPMHPADDLARCLRYYEVIADPTSGNLQPAGIATAGSQFAQQGIPYRAIKPVTPTLTVVGTWALTNCTGPTLFGDKSIVQVRVTSAAAGQFYAGNTNSGNTVTLEANV